MSHSREVRIAMIYAALDIGGTKTIAALTDENGSILTQKKFTSFVASSQTCSTN